ncbi:MAG: selenocysteine synthase [Candidatus Rokubacteria bacterium]|nr:selenocysteine synthase [Candidatus Rokubacteria bacterium]
MSKRTIPGGQERPRSSATDRFGNRIDPLVGYARGAILCGPVDDAIRKEHAYELMRRRHITCPPLPLFNFTGNHRNFLLTGDDLADGLGEEWSGPARFKSELDRIAREHMGAAQDAAVAVFNRCSAGIVSAILALVSPGEAVLSVVPRGRSHTSIIQGAQLAQASLIEVEETGSLEVAVGTSRVGLAILTGVTSELDVLSEEGFGRAIAFCHSRRIPILVDDAYGSRLRPVLQGQPKTCALDVDLGITSCDKAGILGPRSGLLVGRPGYVHRALARGSQVGLEARSPLALAVLRALERYTPKQLETEISLGRTLREALAARYGEQRVRQTAIGPSICEEDILEIAAERAGFQPSEARLVAAEVSCALGMVLLREWGIITVNAAAQPGARVSLRLKPAPQEVERFGGVEAVLEAIDKGFDLVAALLHDEGAAREVIFGGTTPGQ